MPSCPLPRRLITVDPRVNWGEYSRSWPSSSYEEISIGSPATCSNTLTAPRLLIRRRNDLTSHATADMLRPQPTIATSDELEEGEEFGGARRGRRRWPQGAWTQLHPEEVTGEVPHRGAYGPGIQPALRARGGDGAPAPGRLPDRLRGQLGRGRRRRVAADPRQDQGRRHSLDRDVDLVRASLLGRAAGDRAPRRHLQRTQRGRPVPALQQGGRRGGDRQRGRRPRVRGIHALQHDPPRLRGAPERRHLLGGRCRS